MCELKFRAWDGEQMVSPDYIDRDGIAHWKADSIPTRSSEIMQFTGLLDRAGAEIYEGDIVEINMGQIFPARLKVVYGGPWEYAGFGLTHKRPKPPFEEWETDETWDMLNPQYAKDCEVIGNVHENPELLK